MRALILRVIVVDDSEMMRRLICRILLSQADIEIICEASDGAEAVRMVREHRPDVVLLDITMPVMNGFEAARQIKHEFPSTLILMVSQFDTGPFVREATAAGASGYVVKSNASTELIPALRRTVSEHMPAVASMKGMETRFTDVEEGLLERAFQLRESQTQEQRAMMRAEFEVKWPALVAYVKHREARGEKMRGDVLFELGEGQGGPSLEKIVWYMLDRAVRMDTKSRPLEALLSEYLDN